MAFVLLVGVVTYKVLQDDQKHNKAIQDERALYAKLDSQAQNYIQAINSKYPGKVTHKDSCSYTSTEGGRGALGCEVDSQIEFGVTTDKQLIINYADDLQENLQWGKGENITSNTTGSADKTMLYLGDKKQSCTISFYSDTKGFLVDASCSGGALAEYYPVVSD